MFIEAYQSLHEPFLSWVFPQVIMQNLLNLGRSATG